MSGRTRGIYLENAVKAMLEDLNWFVIRSAGSHGVADLVACKRNYGLTPVTWLIQAKVRESLLGSREWSELFLLASAIGAMPVLATRPSPRKTAFYRLLGPRAFRSTSHGLLEEVHP